MLSALRHDLSALASGRVIETLVAWQADARGPDPERAAHATRMLEAVGRALLPAEPEAPAEGEVFEFEGVTALPMASTAQDSTDDHTVDSFQLPPKPVGLRREATVAPDFDTPPTMHADDAIVAEAASDTDSRVERHTDTRAPRHVTTGASLPPTHGFADDDEKPTRAFLRSDTGLDAPPPPPPPPPLPMEARASPVRARIGSSSATILPDLEPSRRATPFDEDDKPTRHIDLPEAQRRVDEVELGDATENGVEPRRVTQPPRGRAAYATPPEHQRTQIPRAELNVPDAVGLEEQPEQTVASFKPGPAVAEEDATEALLDGESGELIALPSQPDLAVEAEERGPSRLAPKPGVIRRRSTRARRPVTAPPKPRAAMHHVRALYGLLVPFASELIPLPYERRSRRFWARWREVAGDRGVRREFIEDLLRDAKDTRQLVCALISEVQSVDLKSVHRLVEKLESSGDVAIEAQPVVSDRTRGPLVGASVRVEGVVDEDA